MLRLEMLLASVLPAPPGLRRAALDESVDAPRLRHEADLERPRDQRPVAEEPADQALVDLDRADSLQTYRRGPAPKRAAHEGELVVGHDHVGSLPPPDGAEREQRRCHDERGACEQRGPREREEKAAGRRNQKGARQRRHEHDSVTPGVEIDPLAEDATHARGFAADDPGPAGVSPRSNLGLAPAAEDEAAECEA